MKNMTFENAMGKLEKLVKELEGGDLPLESALKKFEEGMHLSRYCQDKLEEVEKKVSTIIKGADGTLVTAPFVPDEKAE